MQTFASVFERILDQMILAEITNIKGQLAAGSAVATIEDYRRLVGKIDGLTMALDLFEDAKKAAEER